MTSFMLFSQEHRADVRAKHPEMATTEVAKKLGEMWRALSDSKKQKYKDAAAAGKEGKGKKDAGSDSEESSSSEEEEEEEEKQKKESKPKVRITRTRHKTACCFEARAPSPARPLLISDRLCLRGVHCDRRRRPRLMPPPKLPP